MSGIDGIKQLTENPHVNLYEMTARKRSGEQFPYYTASRARKIAGLKASTGENPPDGVIIYALCGAEKDHVVLIRQMRYTVGRYIYEFPAGLVEKGEDIHGAAQREMLEETGMVFHSLKVDPLYEKNWYSTAGLSDESCSTVYGYCEDAGLVQSLEDTEDISVVIADRAQVRQILKNCECALPAAYHLMHFLHDEDPFAFLKPEEMS